MKNIDYSSKDKITLLYLTKITPKSKTPFGIIIVHHRSNQDFNTKYVSLNLDITHNIRPQSQCITQPFYQKWRYSTSHKHDSDINMRYWLMCSNPK